MKRLLILFATLFWFSSSPGGEPGREYEEPYRDRLLYVHAFLNYELNAFWLYEWEQRFFSSNGFRLTVGSVTTTDLLGDGQLALNPDLGGGWRFRGVGTWLATRHLNVEEKSTFMGLERHIFREFSIFLLTDPAYDKENTDASLGVLAADKSREKYLSVALVWDDFVYGEKNSRGGVSIRDPLAFQWFLRYGKDKWWVYSEGKLSTGFERSFPDQELSPREQYHRQRIQHLAAKAYYRPAPSTILAGSFYYYRFDEAKNFYRAEYNYRYHNALYGGSLECIFPAGTRARFRALSHYVRQEAGSSGFNSHDFRRGDLLAGVFYERLFARHSLDLGYMAAFFDWNYNGFAGQGDDRQSGYVDKLKLGWSYAFAKSARIHISISHQVNVGGFGGANLQYLMFF